jgi:hypothetical protein
VFSDAFNARSTLNARHQVPLHTKLQHIFYLFQFLSFLTEDENTKGSDLHGSKHYGLHCKFSYTCVNA